MIEALVALGLLSTLMAGMVALLIFGSRGLRQLSSGDIQQQLDRALRTMHDEMCQGTSTGLDRSVAGSCIWATPYGTADEADAQQFRYTGTNLQFRSWVGYFLVQRQLRRAEQSMGGGFPLLSLPMGSRPTAAALGGLRTRVLARDVEQFEVSSTSFPGVVHLRLALRREVDSSRYTELRSDLDVLMRN